LAGIAFAKAALINYKSGFRKFRRRTAILAQPERFYAHDPDAKGFGVYCVFWFGDERPQPIPTPPNGMSRPQCAGEMERMLRDLVPTDKRQRLAVIVIDVSGAV
jgi:hypothetical protein